MNRKIKLSLCGCLFLGINGAIIPQLGDKFNFLKSLENVNWGGAIVDRRQVKVEKFNHELNKDLRSRGLTEIEFSENSSRFSEVKLEASNENLSLGLQIEPVTKEPAIAYRISSLYGEITKEEKVEGVKQKIDSKFEELSKKYLGSRRGEKTTNPLSIFNRTKNQLQLWRQKARQKRASPTESLSSEQRKNLKDFFELYEALTKEKQNFSSELQKISDTSQGIAATRAEALTSQSNSKEVMLSLRKLNWDGPQFITNLRDQQENLKFFYDSDVKAKEDLRSWNEEQQTLNKRLQHLQSPQFQRSLRYLPYKYQGGLYKREIWKLKNLIKNSSESKKIQFNIGTKLLEWMGQLKDN